MFDSFIFDMDGVIIDSEPLHFEIDQYLLEKLGLSISSEELEKFVGMTNPEMWSKLKNIYQFKESVSEIVELQLQLKIAHLTESAEEPIEGIRELLQTLKEHNKLIGLASSSSVRFIEAVLDKFALRQYFLSVVSGEEVGRGKPAPDVYVKAAELLGTPVSKCLAIEDSRNGLLAAKAAGMKCIGFQNRNSGSQDLSKADLIVQSIRELDIDVLENL